MKKPTKIVSFLLAMSMVFSIIFSVINNEKIIYANENNNQIVLKEENDFVLKEDVSNGIMYLYLKTFDISNERLEEIFKLSENFKVENRDAALAFTIIVFLYQVYSTEMKPHFDLEREHKIRLNSIQNGWIDITKYDMTTWYYKVAGEFKTGWLYDEDYKGWYYFSPEYNFMFDPRYSKSEWLAINNKWYWFKIGGKLKELSGWQKYSDKWMYHIPGDYGALAGCLVKIDKKYYIFDSDGYMIYESVTAPDLSKFGKMR